MANYDVENNFKHHEPSAHKRQQHEAVRETFQEVAETIIDAVPESRERSLALTKIEEAMFWTNAAIARSKE